MQWRRYHQRLHNFFPNSFLMQSVRYAPAELLIHHIIDRALLRLDIQFQIGDGRALFSLTEVGLCGLHQRVQIDFAALKLHNDRGLETVCLHLVLSACFCGGCLFLRRHGLSSTLLFDLGFNSCADRLFLIHDDHLCLIMCWAKFPAHYIW